jgi:hypothetical protein
VSELEYERDTILNLITRLQRIADSSLAGSAYRDRLRGMVSTAIPLVNALNAELDAQRGCKVSDAVLFAYCMTLNALQTAFHALYTLDNPDADDLAQSVHLVMVDVQRVIADALDVDHAEVDANALLNSMTLR